MNRLYQDITSRHKKALLNKRETAKELGISISSLDRLRQLNGIKEKKVGSQIMFSIKDIVEFIGE